jgi:predicted membrane protein
MKTVRCLAVLALLLSVQVNAMAAPPDISPEKRAALEQLFETTGALQLGQQFSSAMVTSTSLCRTCRDSTPSIRRSWDARSSRSFPSY